MLIIVIIQKRDCLDQQIANQLEFQIPMVQEDIMNYLNSWITLLTSSNQFQQIYRHTLSENVVVDVGNIACNVLFTTRIAVTLS